MSVSKNRGTSKSSILIGFPIIFTIHFGGLPPLFLETPIFSREKNRRSNGFFFRVRNGRLSKQLRSHVYHAVPRREALNLQNRSGVIWQRQPKNQPKSAVKAAGVRLPRYFYFPAEVVGFSWQQPCFFGMRLPLELVLMCFFLEKNRGCFFFSGIKRYEQKKI